MTAEHCTIEDFVKVDMRVARVLEAKHVEGADKLLQLTLSLGGEERRHGRREHRGNEQLSHREHPWFGKCG